MKKLITVIACMTALTLSAIAAGTNTNNSAPTESWVLSLGGAGSTVTKGDTGTQFGVDLSLGHTGHLVLPLEAGLRQGVTYDGSSTTIGTTKLYSDWTLFTVLKTLDVFVGGNVGLSYGNTTVLWTAAPEAGARLWLKKDVAVLARVEVPFDLNGGKYTDTLRYSLGVAVKF
jgi:hypothetical protein